MKRIMISAMSSGSGKTMLTCGLMGLLKQRGMDVRGFKCGPDYIDPMFHSRVLGIPSRNLDLFLQGTEGVRRTLFSCRGEIAVLEGAMGFYDGIGGTIAGSAWETACVTNTPVILVLRPRGQSISLAAQVRGMQLFRESCPIAGLILSDCKKSLYDHLKPILWEETGLPVLGCLPAMEEAQVESRHLGLYTAREVEDFSSRFRKVAEQLAKTLDLDALLELCAEDTPIDNAPESHEKRCRIGVARDEAFCFCYQQTLDALTAAGAQLCFFSPLHDSALPEELSGLYLPGGYPELYARQLSENAPMRKAVFDAVRGNMPTVAECGGFLYLQQELKTGDGQVYPMVGALSGSGYPTGGLRRFGYAYLSSDRDNLLFRAGEEIPAHEFHHWDSTESGRALLAKKPLGSRSWQCGICGDSIYAGFPHLMMNETLARRFTDACVRFGEGTL